MSIQQVMNNMLMSAQIGAGLYAHSPSGQKQAEYRKTKVDYQKAEAHEVDWRAPKAGEEHISDLLAEQQAKRAEKMAMLKPTQENINRATEDREAYENSIEDSSPKKSAETKALESLALKIGSLTDRLSNFEKRKTILKKKKGGNK